jgi:ribosome biogenesis GTPase
MFINEYGWSPRVETAFGEFIGRGLSPARVVACEYGAWMCATADGERLVRHARGGAEAVTGDWVACRAGYDSIAAVLPRANAIVRRAAGTVAGRQALAANADIAFAVMGLDGDYNPRRLERYAALCGQARVRMVTLLNKSDLGGGAGARVAEARAAAGGGEVFPVSALTDDLEAVLFAFFGPGETAVLLGSSGAGKSTIVNRLLGRELQSTQPVRSHDSRGRHTTTRRSLIRLPCGRLLMDLPGIREAGLLPGSAEEGARELPERLKAEARPEWEIRRENRILHRAAKQFYRMRGKF